MQVQKRDGRLEDLNIDKLHKVAMYACEDITGVSNGRFQIQFLDSHKQKIFQETLIKSAQTYIL